MSSPVWREGGTPLVFVVPFLLAVALAVAACPSPENPENAERSKAGDSVTQRERYEAVGESNLSGARGVRGALDASDDIRARDARRDSILQDR